MPPISRLRATLLGLVTAAGLLVPQAAAQAAPDPGKIDATVRAQLAQDDKATFWVRLKGEADLSGARRALTKEAKAERVFEAKTEQARSSQAGLRKLLDAQHADYRPFWIVNAVKVTAGEKLAAEIASLPEVERIDPVRTLTLPKPVEGSAQARVNAVEWNIDRVNAPRVWDELGNRGEGIVIANIDSGVQFDHPDLAASYRGRNPDGTYTHDYNWFDPAGVCPTAAPCDNNDHGTHVMGTMVGANGIGVAPGAKWIAAKGCEVNTCTDASLLAAGQWVMRPTDLNGQNPRPDLAPDIVNNSWGGSGFDPFYKDVVDAWVAAGIFPAFSNGNEGPACDTSGSPGQYVNAYSAGAFDVNNALYARSSKGEGENGEIKPNIAAPGVNVRSSVPGGYDSFTGTSMASPHVAATVALIWSASPGLQGNVAATRPLLDGTAVDVADTSCGGTAADNNVWGEGRLDTYAAVLAAPDEGLGDLSGTVTAGGAPLSGVTVTVSGPMTRTIVTGADGTYAIPRLLAGSYEVAAEKFGYARATTTVTITAGQAATADVPLTVLPTGVVSGTVTTAGTPEPGTTVAAAGTPVSAVTDASGRYSMTLPHGSYELRLTPSSRCSSAATAEVTVAGDVVKDVELPLRGDNFGYTCRSGAQPYQAGSEKLALTGDDEAQQVTLPFPVPFYGTGYTKAWIATNGFVTFADRITTGSNGRLPTSGTPNNAVYPYWDDLVVDAQAGVYTAVTGTAPHRVFVVEWRNVTFYNEGGQRVSFAALLGEDGSIAFRYQDVESERDRGSSATVGIENAAGNDALLYSYEEPVLATGQGLTFTASRHGLVTGKVTDANDGDPIAGATVKIGDVATLTTAADGTFYGQVLAGDYEVVVSKEHYGTFTRQVTVAAATVTRIDTALVTGRVSASTAELTVVLPAESSRTRTLELTNLGTATPYTVTGEPWFTVTPAAGELAKGQRVVLEVELSSAGVAAGTFRTGKLLVKSASGRQPTIEVKVTVVVPKLQVAIDTGATRSFVDAAGDTWTPDKKYAQGGYGYLTSQNRTQSTSRTIAGTPDQALFRTARESMLEYRFDNVPAGTYTVELDFAEIKNMRMGQRVFDVLVEGQLAIPALDLALESGTYTAVSRQYTVKVTDGQLNVRFATRQGATIVNGLRISERPDKAAS
ncbi:Copper binding protein, plastocyanin/azurin family [[Actinomadura] parvosata subsp. kistnae]|uniref:S8 family serine peptidase n=1 Tax=[Actinomadura] parvosata TaxID=1955412 RepID=UPI0009AECF19|nr:S8 family serine peptidase [Nonomuraea sp. ATCC 55076]SPL87421.1 Copper binding protein, plastocyanin/azurin family [Actinomadura parvosata subsp. kistnae]